MASGCSATKSLEWFDTVFRGTPSASLVGLDTSCTVGVAINGTTSAAESLPP